MKDLLKRLKVLRDDFVLEGFNHDAVKDYDPHDWKNMQAIMVALTEAEFRLDQVVERSI